MKRVCLALAAVVVLWGVHVSAQNVTFRVINGGEAKYLERQLNRTGYDTLLWGDRDTVLFLSYGRADFVINVDARSGTIASRLGI